jgi:hypothetical protein
VLPLKGQTLFILIVIAVLPLKGQRKNGHFYCLGFDHQRCFFCRRNLYVDALKFDIGDPDVSIFFFWFKVMEWF